MKAAEMRALITGASGGIGCALARELHGRGASVLLVGRNAQALERAAQALGGRSARVDWCAADLATVAGRARVVEAASLWGGSGINVLVNNAGCGDFGMLDEVDDAAIERLFAINAIAPMQLTRALLPTLRSQPASAILNIGSVFGSLGYPGFTAYSATKFALRGFTEALRREMADSKIGVHYFAPRATKTGMNSAAVDRMNAELKVAMDPPAQVAAAACAMLEAGKASAVLGWPEKLFVRINALLPGAVDGSLRKQLPVIRRHAATAVVERATQS
ncbi:MAG: SDR family oxidoreductase [Steroidobacteraceae bacterium]|jgi:short-subunit dehydrogenase|nr:SDR family oxidoreductase [Steroidobacteraceae bacterium]